MREEWSKILCRVAEPTPLRVRVCKAPSLVAKDERRTKDNEEPLYIAGAWQRSEGRCSAHVRIVITKARLVTL